MKAIKNNSLEMTGRILPVLPAQSRQNQLVCMILLMLLGSWPCGKASAQTASADSARNQLPFQNEIRLLAQYKGDSVVLRWAPGSPGGWAHANLHGYTISRAVLDENGILDPAAFRPIHQAPVKPWPLEQWQGIAGEKGNNDYAKIAAQALYGKNFVPSNGFIAQADEFVSRYSFALLAADLSPATATALGLRFTDRTIEKGKIYVYKVESYIDTLKYKLQPGFISVNTADPSPNLKPVIAEAKEYEKLVEIFWEKEIHEQLFTAYFVERSDDNGKNYKRLHKLPFINPVSEKNPQNMEYFIFGDSLAVNYKPYLYRLIGIDPFGELSEPSPAVKAMGKDRTPPPVPLNLKAEAIGGKQVRISWEYPANVKELNGFLIGRGNNPTEQFTPLAEDLLSANTRVYIDTDASEMRSNYYIIAAVDTAGNAALSLAKYALMVDSIPPAPPKNLTGNIDTSGVVRISWELGPEPDILGYQVYFSNQEDHQFSQITNGPWLDTVYFDTITVKTLTKKIFYRVVAIDVNHNYSQFSGILELKRPDIVPPSPAIFQGYKVTNEGILLQWVPSQSEDLSRTILYRLQEDRNWVEIASIRADEKINFYQDTKVESGKMYTYSLMAEDDAGLKSKRSLPIKLKYNDLSALPKVEKLDTKIDAEKGNIELKWDYPVQAPYRYVLYRAVNGSNFSSYKSLEAGTSSFTDGNVKKGTIYEYTINVVYPNGRKSGFGAIAKAQF